VILVAVGTQIPFDRLISAVDRWALTRGRTDVLAQIGESDYAATTVKTFDFVGLDKFRALQETCTALVSHAGMGSILTAMELGKPIVIMPRDHHRGEHRNGHQLATAKRFQGVPGVYVAMDEAALVEQLDNLSSRSGAPVVDSKALTDFTDRLRDYLQHLGGAPRSSAIPASRLVARSG